jgi:hypothetical protein
MSYLTFCPAFLISCDANTGTELRQHRLQREGPGGVVALPGAGEEPRPRIRGGIPPDGDIPGAPFRRAERNPDQLRPERVRGRGFRVEHDEPALHELPTRSSSAVGGGDAGVLVPVRADVRLAPVAAQAPPPEPPVVRP